MYISNMCVYIIIYICEKPYSMDLYGYLWYNLMHLSVDFWIIYLQEVIHYPYII